MKLPGQNTLVLIGVFGVIGVVGAYLFSKFQSEGMLNGGAEGMAEMPPMDPATAMMAMAAESELHPEVGIDPAGYNHLPIQILGPAEPKDWSTMNFTGSYTKYNCADPIATYF